MDDRLLFKQHIQKIRPKLVLANYQLSKCKFNTPFNIKLGIYHSLFESHVRFGAVMYGSAPESELEELFVQQKRAVRTITNAHFIAHTDPIFYELKILKLDDLLNLERLLVVHKFKHGRLPRAFPHDFLLPVDHQNMGRRGDINDYIFTFPPTKDTVRLPTNLLIKSWNAIPPELKIIGDIKLFKQTFKDLAIASYSAECSEINCFTCKFRS